jgi:5'-nucleotidase
VAPDVEQSSMGHAITHSRPLSYRPTPIKGFEAYRVNGTPSDCVMLGTTLWAKTDLVLSGINIGTNLGNALWHSGTLAGAKQAALLGLRGIAFSAPATDREQPDFEALKPWAATVLQALLDNPEPCLVNVNFPAQPPRGTLWTRQSMRHYDGKVVPGEDPMGRKHYWFTVIPVEATEEGTDRWAIEQQYAELKDELGLDHFEGRSFVGWHRHVVLTAMAYCWLQDARRRDAARLPTLPVARAVITEILTAHFFVTRPHYLRTMQKLAEINLRI